MTNKNTRVNLKSALLTSFLIIFLPLFPLILIDLYKSYVRKEWR